MPEVTPSTKNSVLVSIGTHWKAITFIFLLIIGGVFGWMFSSSFPSLGDLVKVGPTGMSQEISEDTGKIPFDTKVLTLTLDSPVSPASISPETVTLSPLVEGVVSVSADKKTISYTLSKSLETGETYDLTVASTVQKSDGTPLGKDKIRTFIATPGVQAIKIFPTGPLDTLGQNITVVFNTPMVPLTNLDELPCPLTITPKIEGKCVWTNTSILEFIPSSSLQGSTRYQMEVGDVPGLLHSLSRTLTGEILTTPLRVQVSNTFSPYSGISVSTNFPVSLESLSGSIELSRNVANGSGAVGKIERSSSMPALPTVYDSETLEPIIPIITPSKNEDGTLSETEFIITTKDQPFTYSSSYSLVVRPTLKPKYGTESLGQEVRTSMKTSAYASVSAFQNVKDGSGVLSDTRSFDMVNGLLPNEHLFFLAYFDQEVPLDATMFSIKTEKDTTPIELSIAYAKMNTYDEKGNITGVKDNKYALNITPRSSLKKDTPYQLIIAKKSNPALNRDEIYGFRTAGSFTVSGFSLLSNTLGCVYTNNKILGNDQYYDYSYTPVTTAPGSGSTVVTAPSSRVPTLRFDSGENKWNDQGQNYTKTYTCPQASGKNAYIVDLRLNPEVSYSLDFLPTLTDEYGQELGSRVSFPMKTGKVALKDRYLYSNTEGQTKVIPSSLPIVLGLLSVNTDTVNINVCEMDEAGYIDFLNQQRTKLPNPQCTKNFTKKIPLKNRNWTVTPTQVDLEKEILGAKFTEPYIYISGNLDKNDRNLSQSFSHVFIRSNLSLTLESGNNRRVIFASSYDGKTIPTDLTFTAYRWDYTNSSFETITEPPIIYDKTKRLYNITSTGAVFDLIVAKNSSFYGVLNLSQDLTSNYNFKYISGQDASNRDYLYIYPDRPLYKPSDTVYFKGILRDFRFDGYSPTSKKGKGKIKILGGEGSVGGQVAIAEMDVTIDANSNFHGEFVLPKTAPLGRYTFDFSIPDQYGNYYSIYNNGEFFIEAYKKPVFKVSAEIPKSDALVGDTIEIPWHSEYYFGGALGGAAYQYSIMSANYYFNPGDYSNYSFSEGSAYTNCLYWGSCEYRDTMESSGTGILDKKGDTILSYQYQKGVTKGEQIFTYSLEVTDPDTEKTVNHSVSQIVHATDGYVGIMAPYWNSGGKGIKLNGIVLDHQAKGLASKTVGLELIRQEWKNVKKEGVDGVFYNEGALEETIITTDTAKSDARGEFAYTFFSATGGEYIIRASYTGSNGMAFVSSTYAYVSGGKDTSWFEGNNTVADITADKTILSVGERAGFTLKTPIERGKMFVSIEKDDGILDSYVQDFTGTTVRIEFPILDTYIPNVYVKVFALGQNPGESLPIYKRALAVVKVLPDPKKLSITVTPEKKKYLPGEPVKMTVNVKDANGKAVKGANGSLSMVDQSLLALAGNPIKNPFAFFYDMKRYLGVETYTSLLNLVEKLEIKDTSLGEKGGAGEGQKGGLSKKKRGVFKDTAFWQGDFTTDQNGNFTVTTPVLPDNLTTWVIEALVNTKSTQIGVATTQIQTSKNVLINDNLPRFLGTSDTVEIAPVIFNKTEKDSTFDISVEATNVSLANTKQSIEIKAGSQVAVPFELMVDSIEKLRLETPWASKITIKAVSRVTGDQDTVEMTLPIIETTTSETVATSGRADPKGGERIELEKNIRDNGGSLVISYAGTLLSGLLSGIDFLSGYPYGCIEQKLAALMPQVYKKELYESIGIPYDLSKQMLKRYESKESGYTSISLKDAITEVIGGLASYQRYDGGFGYWTDSLNSDLHLTISTLSRLQSLARIGLSLPSDVLSKAAKYIKDVFYADNRPFCITDCGYSVRERLDMITGVLDATPDDYEAYKMYQLVVSDTKNRANGWDLTKAKDNYAQSVDFSLAHTRLLLRLITLTELGEKEKKILLGQAKDTMNRISSEQVVTNPRGSFIGRSESSSRLANTLGFIELVTLMGGDTLSENRIVLDQMSRWVMSQKKKDGSFGSTLDTTSVIRAITSIERSTGDIRNTDLESLLSLDGNTLEKKAINSTNRLETFSTGFLLSSLKDVSQFRFEKTGTGRIYYDISMNYALKASGIATRDEGFFLESTSYDYALYQAIEKAKNAEWTNYLKGDILYTELKYPKETHTYLTPLISPKVGKLVIVYNRMIAAEPRDQVAFEGFIPAGAELVNPNLKTESQEVIASTQNTTSTYPNNGMDSQSQGTPRQTMNPLFDHEEWQDDRYFGTVARLDAGIYTFQYIFRPTHVGTYELRPSRVGEFYRPEVFGRTIGKSVKIEK